MLTTEQTKTINLNTLDADDTIGGMVAGRPHLRLHADCPVETVLTVMAHNGKRVAAIISRDGVLQGILTRSALFGSLIIGPGFDVGYSIDTSEIKFMTAGDVMVANPAFLPSELSVDDALAIMTEYGFRSMPVLDDGGVLVGMADMNDIVIALQDRMSQSMVPQTSMASYGTYGETQGYNDKINIYG